MTSWASRRSRQHRRTWNDSLIDIVYIDELQLFLPWAAILPTPALSLPLGLIGLVSCPLVELRQWSPNSPQFCKRSQQLGQDMGGILNTGSAHTHPGLSSHIEQTGSFLSVSLHHLPCFWIKQLINWKEMTLTNAKFSTISLERRKYYFDWERRLAKRLQVDWMEGRVTS